MANTPKELNQGNAGQKRDENFDWEIIIETILEQNCILFIGPRIFGNGQYSSLEDWIASFLQVDQNENIRNYFASDALFQFSSPAAKTKTIINIKKLFREEKFQKVRELYHKIAQIPFHIIFSLTPDTLLQEVFEEEHVNYKFDFYLKNKPPRRLEAPLVATVNTPLLYNMFGFIQSKESLVLTHDDLFDYFNSILGENSMHPDLRQAIKKAENFLFLGISFDKWYMQLLLKLLYRLHEKEEFLRYANYENLNKETHRLFTDQFRIEFINKDIPKFVDELHAKFAAIGKLRTGVGKKEKITEQLRNLIRENKLFEGMNGLLTFLEKLLDQDDGLEGDSLREVQKLRDDLIQLMARHRRLQERINKEVISSEEINLTYNKITENLLQYIQMAESLI